jgi:hypothetical protein
MRLEPFRAPSQEGHVGSNSAGATGKTKAESTVDAALGHRESARQLIAALLVALLVLAVLGAAVAAFR